MFNYGNSYGAIGGALPWAGNSISGFASGNPGAIAANYQQAYNNALAMNQSNYSNILAGYQQALAAQTTAQSAIASGYTNLYNDVLNKIGGLGAARATEIRDEAKRATAASTQGLIDRGLGNTTVLDSQRRGVASDMERRLIENDESVRGQQAGYMTQLGLAGLGNSVRAYDANTGLYGRQLDWMNSVTARYPDMAAYVSAIGASGRGGGYGGGGAIMAPPKVGYTPTGFSGWAGGYQTPSYGGGGGGGGWLMDQYRAGGGGGDPTLGGYYGGGDGGSGFWGNAANEIAAGSLYGYDNPGNSGGGFWGNTASEIAGGGGGFWGNAAADVAGGYGGDSSWFNW